LLKDTAELLRLRKAGKRELLRIPRDEMAIALHEDWVERFWHLPPEAWETAVDLRLEEIQLRGSGQDPQWTEFQRRSREFWARHGHPLDSPEELEPSLPPEPPPQEPPTAEEIEELQRIAESLRSEERDRPVRLTEEYLAAMEKIEQAEGLIKGVPLP
jgi:hypothetical protein